MLICGIKLTHDGTVALIEDQRLVFSTEVEKLNGAPRYAEIEDTSLIARALAAYGRRPSDVDIFVVDGWGALAPSDPLAHLIESPYETRLKVADCGADYVLRAARYQERWPDTHVLRRQRFSGLRIYGEPYDYTSSLHTTGHILAAYCTSPFAQREEDSYVLVWDGGIYPSLYYVRAGQRQVEPLGPLFKLFGNAYAMFARNFSPFRGVDEHGLSTAGKVMAYIAQGEFRRPLLKALKTIVRERNTYNHGFAHKLARFAELRMEEQSYSSADFMLTFHIFLQGLLCATLEERVAAEPHRRRNICLSGGCALNIKWNSAIRQLGLFDELYIPPFPNDAGSAIGAACTELFEHGAQPALQWSVYAGPALERGAPAPDWAKRACSIAELARLLHETGEPVVFLHGRAELGPRALGGRSILASPRSGKMKALLNEIKGREPYRPVAPLCLEDRAPTIFDPGGRDPFMLFEHRVRSGWRERIPAVLHTDGTARLQTVSRADHPVMCDLLESFEAISGLPVVCNTSANDRGRGFFPSVAAATAWDGVNYVWSEGVLYSRSRPRRFSGQAH